MGVFWQAVVQYVKNCPATLSQETRKQVQPHVVFLPVYGPGKPHYLISSCFLAHSYFVGQYGCSNKVPRRAVLCALIPYHEEELP